MFPADVVMGGVLGPLVKPWWEKVQHRGLLAKAGETSVSTRGSVCCLVGIPGSKEAFKIAWVRTL